MNNIVFSFCLTCALLAHQLPHALADDAQQKALKQAYEAYQAGSYLTAFEKALDLAEKDNPQAMVLIAQLYQSGLGVKPDKDKAQKWYSYAAKFDEPEALFQLGLIALDYEKDKKNALMYFQKSADLGHLDGAYNTALLMLEADSQIYNKDAALDYFQKSADKDHAPSQHALAIIYQEGTITPQDQAKAATYMGKAALNNMSEAQIEYALMLLEGKGVEKDEGAAFLWLEKAATKEHPVAYSLLAQLTLKGLGTKIDREKAADLYAKAKAKGVTNQWLENRLK
jgi:TPR repeat protein